MCEAPRRITSSAASVGHPHGQAVGDRVGRIGMDRPAGGKGQRVGRGLGGDDADDLGGQAQGVARGDDPGNAAAEPDRHIDDIEIGHGAKQFEAVARHPAHQQRMIRADEVQVVALGQCNRVLVGGLEIVAFLDQPRAERRHCLVLLDAVAVGHDDRRGEAEPRGGKGDALPVIAAGRRHHA